jgi:hypothetical protein
MSPKRPLGSIVTAARKTSVFMGEQWRLNACMVATIDYGTMNVLVTGKLGCQPPTLLGNEVR